MIDPAYARIECLRFGVRLVAEMTDEDISAERAIAFARAFEAYVLGPPARGSFDISVAPPEAALPSASVRRVELPDGSMMVTRRLSAAERESRREAGKKRWVGTSEDERKRHAEMMRQSRGGKA